MGVLPPSQGDLATTTGMAILDDQQYLGTIGHCFLKHLANLTKGQKKCTRNPLTSSARKRQSLEPPGQAATHKTREAARSFVMQTDWSSTAQTGKRDS
uniref:Peptidase S1 domain-containing protein n=1 Tax=Plectus sambesii TaxID=2011161 RepID=A0A914WDH5_9BILA